MPMNDVFTPDAFKLRTLTAAINKLPYQPGRIGELNLFESSGITTLTAAIEEDAGTLSLVSIQPRGASGQSVKGTLRKAIPFLIPHLPERAAIFADEVQGVRAFGSDSQAEVLQTRVNDRLGQMRRNIDYTIEAHRLAAIKGQHYDANGALQSLYTIFGVSQTAIAMALANDATKTRQKCTEVLEGIENALGGQSFSGARVLCGRNFWNALIENKAIKDTYLNTQMAASLRNDGRQAFEFGGLFFERYRGTSAVKIEDDDAYAIPEGVPGLFITRYAPANYNETVNTVGLPYYAKGEPMKFGKGWEMESQSNPINLCTRPAAVIKLTV